ATRTAVGLQSWTGLIGVNYNPNHYPNTSLLNNHAVFYVGMNASNEPITNVYAELAQLQQAGFNTARSYQTIEYMWIDLISQAHRLNMNIVYEADIPQNGGQSDINAAVTVLDNVITAVTSTVFQDTVSLVFAGHENYDGNNVNYLTTAVTALRNALQQNSITAPVSSAVNSGNFVTPSPTIATDMATLINSYSTDAPIAFDPYPFQYGVPVVNAVSITNPPQAVNSIAWDYEQVMAQSFYPAARTILMAETGWATQGDTSSYACNSPGPCDPSIANEATYLSAVYDYVRDASNLSGVLVFYAHDEPAKSPSPNDAENFYGMFDADCNLKNNDTTLLPNTAYNYSSNHGCQGFVQGALLVVVGSVQNQPPFTVAITQQNPETNLSASMNVPVPTQDRTNTNIYPWPNFLVYNNAQLTLTGSSGTVCTGVVPVSGSPLVVNFPVTPPTALNCTNSSGPALGVNCSGTNCFLPGNF
ncbi:MAG TPA: hypothetical protein VI522_02710, partial [Gammaproteobacteria bacterium]|nr:hypothetical protein [Gammaproteobacteria bacterium]